MEEGPFPFFCTCGWSFLALLGGCERTEEREEPFAGCQDGPVWPAHEEEVRKKKRESIGPFGEKNRERRDTHIEPREFST